MVTRMVQTFLEQGEAYDGGENFNRTVIIGMLMVGR
jgi:hypothetical protein